MSPSKVRKSDAGIITISKTERLTFLFNSWLVGLWSITNDTNPKAMKEIVEELTVASERFLRVRYTVRVGASLVGLRWLGHYYLHIQEGPLHIKSEGIESKLFYLVQKRYRKSQKLLRACCTVPNKQVLYFTEVWTFFTGTALRQKYGYPEPAFLQVENVRKKLQRTQQKIEN